MPLAALPRWLYFMDEKVVHLVTGQAPAGYMTSVSILCDEPRLMNTSRTDIPLRNHCWCSKCLKVIKELESGYGQGRESY